MAEGGCRAVAEELRDAFGAGAGLVDVGDALVRTYSGGMIRRLEIMHRGRLATSGTPEELKSWVGGTATMDDVFVKFTGGSIDERVVPMAGVLVAIMLGAAVFSTFSLVVACLVKTRERFMEIVPGDVVLLFAGSIVPADAVVLEARDCHVSEAVLTGESFPVEKEPGTSQPTAPLSKRTNCVFLGTNVRSGTARCLVVATGPSTEFGAIAQRLALRPPDTEFDEGPRHFGYLLTSAMLIMVLLVFVAHMLLGRPPVDREPREHGHLPALTNRDKSTSTSSSVVCRRSEL